MRSIILTFLFALFFGTNLHAQQSTPIVTPEKTVVHTVYSPFVAGLFSSFIPGGGQFYCGETSRGMVFLATYVAGTAIALTSMFKLDESPYTQIVNTRQEQSYIGMMIGGVVIMASSYMGSMVDAVILAKRKNLQFNISYIPSPTESLNSSIGTIGIGYKIRL